MDNEKLLDKLVVNEIKTQSDFLADKIRDMIASGAFSDGYAFPNENDFCKRLKVSRGTLREAYKILDTQGFIHRTKHGTYVKSREDIARQGNFSASLKLADIRELWEFVCALEPEAVALAAKKIDDEGIAELEKRMLACEASIDDSNEVFLERNSEFHAYIMSLADNNLIISALTAYNETFNEQIAGTLYRVSEDLDDVKKEAMVKHRELFEAIKNHEPEKARDIEYSHLLDDIKRYKQKI